MSAVPVAESNLGIIILHAFAKGLPVLGLLTYKVLLAQYFEEPMERIPHRVWGALAGGEYDQGLKDGSGAAARMWALHNAVVSIAIASTYVLSLGIVLSPRSVPFMVAFGVFLLLFIAAIIFFLQLQRQEESLLVADVVILMGREWKATRLIHDVVVWYEVAALIAAVLSALG